VIHVRTRFLFALVVAVVGAGLLAGSDMAAARADTSSADAARATLTVRNSQYGRILFDGSNRVLYGFTRDRRGKPSTCYGACATAWPPYIVSGTLTAGKGTRRSLYGTTRRRDGKRQLTYRGWPLYYYVSDGVGEVLCQNVSEFGGLWLVVRPNGELVRLPR
jgi:predicted lipoprotein with Yx(FWY)xxD motif